jgi:hypothetical protein
LQGQQNLWIGADRESSGWRVGNSRMHPAQGAHQLITLLMLRTCSRSRLLPLLSVNMRRVELAPRAVSGLGSVKPLEMQVSWPRLGQVKAGRLPYTCRHSIEFVGNTAVRLQLLEMKGHFQAPEPPQAAGNENLHRCHVKAVEWTASAPHPCK